ncbi:MAG: tripartite tricarboxylate transporter permease [Candidatus Rokubacteria bacterium]|nr:tripartite tricarboxylate transporter permease [Candidatus Rokubacteria bacterium]
MFLILATMPLARFALEFGPWEYFSLFVLALSMVAGLTERSLPKGFLSGVLGLIITVIGSDPIMAVPRFTFGTEFLRPGFQFLPVLIGIFAFAQIMTGLERMGGRSEPAPIAAPTLRVSHLAVVRDIVTRPVLLLWSTVIGVLIGVLPAVGGAWRT